EALGPAQELHRAVGAVEVELEPEEALVLERAQRGVDAERQAVEELVRVARSGGDGQGDRAERSDGEQLRRQARPFCERRSELATRARCTATTLHTRSWRALDDCLILITT